MRAYLLVTGLVLIALLTPKAAVQANDISITSTPGLSSSDLTDLAMLSGGSSPTGTISFFLFAPGVVPNANDSNNVYSDFVSVNGDGIYSTNAGTNPGGFSPTTAGTYQWVAVYSGDHNNSPVTSPFGEEPETVTTAAPEPSSLLLLGTGLLSLGPLVRRRVRSA